jgi:molybdopterin-guanine dinucleotide biosynthesis protein A
MEISCAILSGGRSRRMGQDKALVQIQNRTLIERTYDVARMVFDDIMIVSSHHDAIGNIEARVVPDVLPISGSITGVVSALLHSNTARVFVLGCDMPFLKEEAIKFMVDEVRDEDVFVPKTDAGFEPLHAIYDRTCISALLVAIERGKMKVTDVFSFLRVRTFQPSSLFFSGGVSVFTNINTREDLYRAESVFR